MPCIADDSGLCIDIFDGWPGIYTARFFREKFYSRTKEYSYIRKKMKDLKRRRQKKQE